MIEVVKALTIAGETYEAKLMRADSPSTRTRVFCFNMDVAEPGAPREIARVIASEALVQMGVNGVRSLSYSAKAGCECGCSPGFIVDGDRGWELFVEPVTVEAQWDALFAR